MNIRELVNKINCKEYIKTFEMLYGTSPAELEKQRERYVKAINAFSKIYPSRTDVHLFSAPGRTEIGGNHTDHQHGCVLAAAVNLDVISVVAFHNEKYIRIKSEGYEAIEVSLDELEIQPNETGSSAIVRGIAAKFVEIGVEIGGFDLYSTSNVLCGSGISSSAAFETLVGTVINNYYNNKNATPFEIAKIGQFAENVYFGKKSGLMDQTVSSVGGLVAIDFKNTDNPEIKPFQYNFEEAGYCLCITDTKGNHANLTDDYVAIRNEMEGVAQQFGQKYLRSVPADEFYAQIPQLRKKCSDRAIMRAVHFFEENQRAVDEANALKEGNIDKFLELVRESGDSSANLLQNLYSVSRPTKQEIPLAIAISKRVLQGKGAVRVHGGGFAGTIQAFVPTELKDAYAKEMTSLFGEGSCYVLRIRPVGGIEITE